MLSPRTETYKKLIINNMNKNNKIKITRKSLEVKLTTKDYGFVSRG